MKKPMRKEKERTNRKEMEDQKGDARRQIITIEIDLDCIPLSSAFCLEDKQGLQNIRNGAAAQGMSDWWGATFKCE